MSSNERIDPILLELIRNTLGSIVDEMAFTIHLTGHSEIIRDAYDLSVAILDRKGRMIVQSVNPLQVGSMAVGAKDLLHDLEGDLDPGDVILTNDPYGGISTHLPDVFMFKPIFHEGQLIAVTNATGHQTDMGGRVAGSNASDSTELCQEGLRLAPLKFLEKGRFNPTLVKIIEKNVRVPDRVLGDLRGLLAACNAGEREFLKLVNRYGMETLDNVNERLLAYAEQRTADEIATWPAGVYEFTDYLDDDGFGKGPIPLKCKITVGGGSLDVDFAGSAPQVRGAINCVIGATKAATFAAVRTLLSLDIPDNEGYFRCIRVSAPEGSIVNCLYPAPVAARAMTTYRVAEVVFGALAQVLPDRIPAGPEGGNTVVAIGGYQDRKPFVMVDMINGNRGGYPDKDGMEAQNHPTQNMRNTPIERLEARLPIRIERYGFVTDTGGPGRYRGGAALERQYRLLSEEAVLQARSDRRVHRPYGLAGGRCGAASVNELDGQLVPTKITEVMKQGQVFRHQLAGGGGHGDPITRETAKVLHDVLEGMVSIEAARRDYGVVIDPHIMTVDEESTKEVRREMARSTQ